MVLLIADMLHPVNDLSVELLLDRKVSHAGNRRGSVPVLFTGRKPDHIAGANLLDWTACALHPATACGHDKSLSQWMSVPSGPRTRLERHASALNKRRIRRLEERI